jgi:flavin reductase (DIM6/NTAB) family NADH-FMN oxidoreductase RutF
MGRLATGVTLVTTRLGGHLHGMTANSVTSVSLDPLLILVCVDKGADTHDIIVQSGVFAVNILSQGQLAIAERFAKKAPGHHHAIADIPHFFAVTGSPIVHGCLAYLDCRTAARYEGGDHTIFVGDVLEARAVAEEEPLIFYRGQYRSLGLAVRERLERVDQ